MCTNRGQHQLNGECLVFILNYSEDEFEPFPYKVTQSSYERTMQNHDLGLRSSDKDWHLSLYVTLRRLKSGTTSRRRGDEAQHKRNKRQKYRERKREQNDC